MILSIPTSEDILAELRPVRRYAIVLTRDQEQAEDLVQEALTQAIAGLGSWRPPGSLRRWLLSIVHNAHVSRLRRLRTEAAANEQLGWLAVQGMAAPQPAQVELSQTLDALMGLPDEQREALILVAFDAMPYKDAAQILGIPIGTLMSRLARGREALRLATHRDAGAPLKAQTGRLALRVVSG
jgi:RNA polymerase sigma-70 factor (ECF subfamily)